MYEGEKYSCVMKIPIDCWRNSGLAKQARRRGSVSSRTLIHLIFLARIGGWTTPSCDGANHGSIQERKSTLNYVLTSNISNSTQNVWKLETHFNEEVWVCPPRKSGHNAIKCSRKFLKNAGLELWEGLLNSDTLIHKRIFLIFCLLNQEDLGPNHLPTSLMADLHQDIHRVSSFSRCLNGTFPWRKYSVKALVS